jgi:hypothetical protein
MDPTTHAEDVTLAEGNTLPFSEPAHRDDEGKAVQRVTSADSLEMEQL